MLNHPAALQTKGKYLIYAKSCDLIVLIFLSKFDTASHFCNLIVKTIWCFKLILFRLFYVLELYDIGCKDIEITKPEFVARTQLLNFDLTDNSLNKIILGFYIIYKVVLSVWFVSLYVRS